MRATVFLFFVLVMRKINIFIQNCDSEIDCIKEYHKIENSGIKKNYIVIRTVYLKIKISTKAHHPTNVSTYEDFVSSTRFF